MRKEEIKAVKAEIKMNVEREFFGRPNNR